MTTFQILLLLLLLILLTIGNTLCLEFMNHISIKHVWRKFLAIPPLMMLGVFFFGLWLMLYELGSWVYNTIKRFISE